MQVTVPTCPYCNAPVTSATNPRVVCGRCGEAFTLLPAQQAFPPATQAITATPRPAPPRTTLAQFRARFRGRNLLLAAGVLGVMVLMATVALLFALRTQEDRRANDTALKKRQWRPIPEEPLDAPATISASRLVGLGYLPRGTQVVLGIHFAELERDKVGRQLLDQPVRIGRFQLRPVQLAEWCGLPRSQIDHLALGIAADDLLLARAVLIVRTRQAYDPEQVSKAIQGERVPATARKNLYRISLPGLGLPATIWCVDDQTLALALVPSHLDAVPERPASNLANLNDDTRGLLQDRVERGASLWLAGAIDDKMRKLVDTLAAGVSKDNLDRLAGLRGAAGWVQLQQQVRVGTALQMRDDKPAEELEKALEAIDNPALKASRDGSWVTIQYKTDLASVQKALER